MEKIRVSELLWDHYQMLQRYLVGKRIKNIISCTEYNVVLLMEDGTMVDFSHYEDELLFDIRLPAAK